MAVCDRNTSCEFFNDRMAKLPATAELFKKKYCHENHANCARYMLMSLLSEKLFHISEEIAEKIIELVPILAPNEQEKVRELLS